MDILQIIPLLSLTAYFFYMTYYYVIPMFRLKVLLFAAHMRYRNAEILFRDGMISMRLDIRGQEQLFERPLEEDPLSRFFAMTACTEFRALLREIRKAQKTADRATDE
ncbi:MAG: hypothetical protein K6C12_05985 [Oscillospiraceae bacterium]|nr:hypothetical protein [Oscillospiraceae bacterium]